jgi:hypothetical protein
VIAFHVVPAPDFAIRGCRREPEDLAARRLQVVPHRRTIDVEELVPGDFHVHRAAVDETRLFTEPHRPHAVHAMPRALVAEHEQLRIGRRELQVIEPRGGAVNDPLRARRGVHREHRHRNLRLGALQQPHFLGVGEAERLAVLAGGCIVRIEPRIARALLQLPLAFRMDA